MMTDLASKIQLRFNKIILKLSKSTTGCMVYSELGHFPLEVQAKCRMLNIWFKLLNINYKFKFSNIMYKFFYEMYKKGKYMSPFLSIKTVLNGIYPFHLDFRACAMDWRVNSAGLLAERIAVFP